MRRPAWPRPSRPHATRSSTSRTGSTPTRSRPSRSTTRRPGSPRSSRGTGSTSSHPAGSLATAIRATRRGGRGGDGPRIGILAEYDALPGLGHGCGHNTMAASGVGAAIALAAIADELPGRDRLPRHAGRGAGERQGDHDRGRPLRGPRRRAPLPPVRPNHVRSWPLASEDVDVVFHGLQAHASSDPWKGRNALDALILLFTSVGLWRQQLRPTARVHGIVREGGTAANIIPDRASAWFMIRSDDEAYYETMRTGSARCARPRRSRPGPRSRSRSRARASTMQNNEVLAERFRGEHGGLRHRRPGRRPERGQHRHGQRQLGLPDDPPGPRHLRRRAARATRSCSATRPRRRGRTRRRCSRRPSSPRRPTTCSPIRSWSRPPGANSAATDRPSSGRAGRVDRVAGATIPGRAPLDDGFEPAAPPARRSILPRPSRARLREEPVAKRTTTTSPRRTSPPATAGTASSRPTPTSTCRPTSARSPS